LKLGWGSRQILSFLTLAIVLVATSGLLEISHTLETSAERAAIEAGLVTDSVQRMIVILASEHPDSSLSALSADPNVETLLQSGLAYAPSVEAIMVCDPSGVAVAHAIPGKRDQWIEPLAPLPSPKGLRESMNLFLELRSERPNYQFTTELMRGNEQFASIRAHVSGTLLWAEVSRVLRRGSATGVLIVLLALGLGMLFGRSVRGRMRMLQEGVAAIRRGASDPIPEKSAAMFGPLARELNILRDRVQMEPRVLASMGQLATGMAHEIHQPLQAIKFELESLRNARDMPGDDLESHVDEAKSAVDRMHKSVEGFLRVVRLKPMAVDSIELNPLLEDVRDTLETTANLAGMELDLDLDPDLPETYADAQVLRQAMENLVRNAIQATPSQEGRVTIRSRSENDGLSLSVIDTGPGIPEAVQQKIFSFYFTTKPTGTGVGLALVRQAAEIHSGQIKIESEVGHGTTMTIHLPRRAG